MKLYHPPDGDINVKYKLLCFLTPNKKNSERKAPAFNRDRCCHLALCLRLILFHKIKWSRVFMVGWKKNKFGEKLKSKRAKRRKK
jgi:hypothetical protein